jgi:chemotaxis protein methyltransferase CheR
LTGPDFEHFCRLVHDRSGLVLTQDKLYLVSSRLAPIAQSEGLAGVPELLSHLRTAPIGPLIQRCVDAMATHESSFFRDGAPFVQLAEKALPQLIAARQSSRSLRFWCAACSSGQEPYSLAILLQEIGAQMPGWRLEIVATDMSNSILEKTKTGLYSDFEVRRGLSPERQARWFTKSAAGWEVAPVLKQVVRTRTHNLLHGARGMGVFDVILCRNVMIYFDLDRKRRILDEMKQALAPDGLLMLGSAETILGVTTEFEQASDARGFYRRADAPTARTGTG